MSILKVTDKTFDEEVRNTNKIVLVDFSSPHCGPCVAMEPILEKLAEENASRLKIVQLDIERNPVIAARLGVSGVPTFLTVHNGQPLKARQGMASKASMEQFLRDSSEMAKQRLAQKKAAPGTSGPG